MWRHHGYLISEDACWWLQSPIASASTHVTREHDGDVDITDGQASGVVECVFINPVRIPVLDARCPRPRLDDGGQRDASDLGHTSIEGVDPEAPKLPSGSARRNRSGNSGDAVPNGHPGMLAVYRNVVCGI